MKPYESAPCQYDQAPRPKVPLYTIHFPDGSTLIFDKQAVVANCPPPAPEPDETVS